MQLKHGWKATFGKGSRRISLAKVKARHARAINLRYETGGNMPPRLKKVDPQGNPVQDYTNDLPPATRAQLLVACKDRWGE